MSHTIDAKGKPCPQPVILAKQAITAGEGAFAVEVDNTTAVGNLQRLGASQGYSVTVAEAAGAYTLSFTKTGEAAAAAPSCCAPSGAYTVLVGRDVFGEGDRALGEILIRMFFYTLLQSEDLPKSICFINAGVRLTACDEQVIGHLKGLAEKGVELLVCGTCLNYYGLADQLQVGTVSNMYDIVSQLQLAGKVVTV